MRDLSNNVVPVMSIIPAVKTTGNPDSTGSIHRVGYVGGKRYIRLVIAKTGTHSTGTSISGIILKGNARHTTDSANATHNV